MHVPELIRVGVARQRAAPIDGPDLTTGVVDAVSYIGLGHVFTANMTGNVVFLGFGFAGTPGLSVPRSLASLAAFFLGAIIGGRIAAALESISSRGWTTAAFWTEVILLQGA